MTNKYETYFPDANWQMIPEHMRGGVERYIMHGTDCGGFLTAVLEGDLFEAGRLADDINQNRLFDYVRFMINFSPANCFGSKEQVRQWREKGGIIGMEKARVPA